MESDTSSSSSDDSVEETGEQEVIQKFNEIFTYGCLCEEMKIVKQALDDNRNKLFQLDPSHNVEETMEDEDLEEIEEIREYDKLCEAIKRMRIKLDKNRNKLTQFEHFISHITTSRNSPKKLVCVVPPIVSPIHELQSSSGDTLENLPPPPILEGTLQLPKFVHDPNEAFLGAPTKESSVLSPPKPPIRIYSPASPPESPPRKIQGTPDAKTSQDLTDSEETYDGKGKSAANPRYRYKKRSTPEISPIGEPSHKTPVKPSEMAAGAREIKTLKSPSPNAGVIRISPSVKRKEVESGESSTTRISKLSESCPDDKEDSKIAKKLKFDDDEKASKQLPIVAGLPLQKNYEPSNTSEYVFQNLNESKQLTSPSSSGVSKMSISSSSSEESSLTSANEDIPRSETGESSLTSESDVTLSEKDSSSLTSVSDLSDDAPN